ncbi:hypothetical protein IMZ48_24040 [Candidatus Bathyarchaeota archaeon]|nr:hypothetical protein [Candidatus Bathyarchaeota archaeon]
MWTAFILSAVIPDEVPSRIPGRTLRRVEIMNDIFDAIVLTVRLYVGYIALF